MDILDQLALDAQAGSIVPFLGAGVSIPARVPGDPAFKPTVDWLCQQILTAMECAPDEPGKDMDMPGLLAQCREFVASRQLDRLAEAASWVIGRKEVLKAVRLDHFTELTPLAAHRYIARMAREGWVREVITTNYDTCLSRAWRSTFRIERKNSPERWPAVIVTGEQYQRLGRPSRLDPGGREGSLRIYKINGCAREWCQQPDAPGATERIRLADPQLADPGTPWKADLLRDRMRSRRLVYSGFNGAEGQVRYTFLSVDGETSRDTRDDRRPYSGPVVHVHEPTATFTQLQLLAQCSAGSSRRPDLRGLVKGGDSIERRPAGVERAQNAPQTTAKLKLSADDFWRVLYRRSIVTALIDRLTERTHLDRRAPAADGFRRGSPATERLRSWLDAQVRHGGDAWQPFEETGEPWDDSRLLMIQTLLRVSRDYPAAPSRPNTFEYYRPLHDDLAGILCLLHLLAEADRRPGSPRGLSATSDRLQAASLWGILPVCISENWHRVLVVDSDYALQPEWHLKEIPRRWLPSLALNIGSNDIDEIEVHATLRDRHDTGFVDTIPCMKWASVLPSSEVWWH